MSEKSGSDRLQMNAASVETNACHHVMRLISQRKELIELTRELIYLIDSDAKLLSIDRHKLLARSM